MGNKQIAIGCDHAGYDLKEALKKMLSDKGFEVKDCGTYTPDSVDYPDFAHEVAALVSSEKIPQGILICGSANGVAMSANKHQKVRAAIAWRRDIAELAKQHNNANILCLPSRFISQEEAMDCVNGWMEAEFEGGRHERRVNKIAHTK